MGKRGNRIWELDFLRGVAIVLVVFDHAFYDIIWAFGGWASSGAPILEKTYALSERYMIGPERTLWRPAFLVLFFAVSGACTILSRNNFLRGLKIWLVALAVSFATFFAQEIFGADCFVLFGVFHCLGLCILAFASIEAGLKAIVVAIDKARKGRRTGEKTLRAVELCAYLAMSLAFFAAHMRFNPRLIDMTLHGDVSTLADRGMTGMFFYASSWWTNDYFPLFPYIAFFFFGAALSRALYRKKRTLMPTLDGQWHRCATFCGRHSLIVYFSGHAIAFALGGLLSLILLGTIA